MNPWLVAWAVWFGVGTAIEIAALVGKRRPLDTWSRVLQWAMQVHRPKWRWVTLGAYVIFSVWFGFHIW